MSEALTPQNGATRFPLGPLRNPEATDGPGLAFNVS